MASGSARVTIPIGSWRGVARPQYGDLDVGRKKFTGYVRQAVQIPFWCEGGLHQAAARSGGRSWGPFAIAVLGDSALDFAECCS